MGLTGAARGLARRVVRKVPLLRKGLRYAKRLVYLPWNFQKHYEASREDRVRLAEAVQALAAAQQRAATADLVNAQTHALATHVSNVLWQELPRLVNEVLQKSVVGPAQQMVAEFRLVLSGMEIEVRNLAERHAACYDQVVEQLRTQTEHLRALAEAPAPAGEVARRLAELAAAQDELAKQVADLRADVDHANATAARLRLRA